MRIPHTLQLPLLATGLAASALVFAHHGWSEYDAGKELRLTGVIKASGYEHPHGHIVLETPDKTWQAVLAPPSRMEARGLSQTMLRTGSTATVVGYPNRSKPDEMRAERIIIDGKTVELR
jgi:hypothetical protein